MKKTPYPTWKKAVWRLVRTSLAAGISQTLLLKPDLTNIKTASTMLFTSFLTGSIVAFFMTLRVELAKEDTSTMVDKIPL